MLPDRLDRMSLAPHAKRGIAVGLAIFVLDVAGYLAFATGAVMFEALWLKLLCSVFAGAFVALLAIVGHDAAHQSFLPTRRLNEIVGTFAFLPALHPFSLWEHHHNKVHHRFTAQIGLDNAYSPMTVDQYRAASPGARAYYRFMRSFVGQPFFYLVDIWWPDMFLPFGRGAPKLNRGNWIDLLIVYAYAPIAVLAFAALSLNAGATTLSAAIVEGAVFGVVIPFLVWNVFIAYVTIVQHTGPGVRWTLPTGQPSSVDQAMAGTVHITLPNVLDWAMHRVMQHQAHHVHVGVPLYHLKAAQNDVGAASHQQNVQAWTPAYHWRLTRDCQLYDEKRHCWVRFADADKVAATEALAA